MGVAAWHASKHNFTPHIPYRALPADNYYFRPYNYTDIPEHQGEVVIYGEDPRLPYANRVFDDIYEGLEEQDVEEVKPVVDEPKDDGSTTNGQSPFVPREPAPPAEPRIPSPPPEAPPEVNPAQPVQPPPTQQGGRLPSRSRFIVFGAPPLPGDKPAAAVAKKSSVRVEIRDLDSLPLSPALPNANEIRQTSGTIYRLSDDSATSLPGNPLR